MVSLVQLHITQPEEGRESFEDYDWEQDRMIKHRRIDSEIYRL